DRGESRAGVAAGLRRRYAAGGGAGAAAARRTDRLILDGRLRVADRPDGAHDRPGRGPRAGPDRRTPAGGALPAPADHRCTQGRFNTRHGANMTQPGTLLATLLLAAALVGLGCDSEETTTDSAQSAGTAGEALPADLVATAAPEGAKNVTAV